MFDEYRFSGSLPENASTYVTREADKELYESLTAGKFCYVLNSRQSGKSSIRVRTMGCLRDAGVECAAIDLSAGGVQNVTPQQWYVDLIDHLIESFDLDVDLAQWWVKNQLHSEVTRFRKFIEEVLLVEVKANIVIFIDEIDSVLSLKFPTDDFFALIRACHNQRVDNSDYNRLTFCLLGVASPSNLIQDKQRTPFNIGTGINLKGFQLHEVEPLRKGLEGKFADSQGVMQEILNWTGGQPFLTQKLCQLMVEESAALRESKVNGSTSLTVDPERSRRVKSQKSENDDSLSVEQVVRSRIIENWELQDEPEHLRTIRSRILRDEERAGYLLDLYQQVRSHGEVANNDSAEQSELLLSGLVGKQQDKLRVYNRIYQEVFNQSWVEAELKKLRPYSETFRAWVASGCVDESRLLRGNALKDAEEWGKDKNLSYQDKQFLAASREQELQEEIAAQEKEAQLERERKDREAAEHRNKVLAEANRKARQRIRNGTVVLVLALLGAGIVGLFANKNVVEANNQVAKVEKDVERKQEEVTNAQTEIKQLEKNEKNISDRATKAEERQKKAIQNQKAVENELKNKKKLLAQADSQQRKLKQEAQELKIKADQSNQQLEDSKFELMSIKNSRQELETQIKTIRQDKKRSQQELNKTKSQLNDTHKEYDKFKQQVADSNEYLKTVEKLAQLAGELEARSSDTEAKELFSQASQSVNIQNHNTKQQVLYAGIAYANLKLRQNNLNREKNVEEAENNIKEAKSYLNKINLTEDDSSEYLQVKILKFRTEAILSEQNKDKKKAIEFYQKAFDTLNVLKNRIKGKDNAVISPPFNTSIQTKLLSKENIEALHREFMSLLPNTDKNYLTVSESLKQHFYDELENLLANKKWQQADTKTFELMLNIAKREEERYLDTSDINKFSCQELQKIDKKWLKASDNIFGFSLQKDIWIEETKKEGLDLTTLNLNKIDEVTSDRLEKAYQRFATRVGWYDKKMGKYKDYSALEWSYNAPRITESMGFKIKSHLPTTLVYYGGYGGGRRGDIYLLFSRAAICKL